MTTRFELGQPVSPSLYQMIDCVVFGMPKEAIRLQAVDNVLPLDKIAQAALSRIVRNSV